MPRLRMATWWCGIGPASWGSTGLQPFARSSAHRGDSGGRTDAGTAIWREPASNASAVAARAGEAAARPGVLAQPWPALALIAHLAVGRQLPASASFWPMARLPQRAAGVPGRKAPHRARRGLEPNEEGAGSARAGSAVDLGPRQSCALSTASRRRDCRSVAVESGLAGLPEFMPLDSNGCLAAVRVIGDRLKMPARFGAAAGDGAGRASGGDQLSGAKG